MDDQDNVPDGKLLRVTDCNYTFCCGATHDVARDEIKYQYRDEKTRRLFENLCIAADKLFTGRSQSNIIHCFVTVAIHEALWYQ